MGVNSLPKTVTRQRRGCDLKLALLRLSHPRHHTPVICIPEQLPSTEDWRQTDLVTRLGR